MQINSNNDVNKLFEQQNSNQCENKDKISSDNIFEEDNNKESAKVYKIDVNGKVLTLKSSNKSQDKLMSDLSKQLESYGAKDIDIKGNNIQFNYNGISASFKISENGTCIPEHIENKVNEDKNTKLNNSSEKESY